MTTTKEPEIENNSRELALLPSFSWASMRTMAEAIAVAELVSKSNAFPKIKNAGQALVLMLAGAEMGFGPFASLSGIHMVQGVPIVGANLKAAAIRGSGRYDYEIEEHSREVCSISFFSLRSGTRRELGDIVVRIGEIPAGLLKKDNWQSYPEDMLFATAINRGFRRFTPDLTGGVPSYDECEIEEPAPPMQAPSANGKHGEVVDANFTASVQPTPPPAPARQYATTHQVQRISELELEFGASEQQVAGWLSHFASVRGVETKGYADLHPDDASALIRDLEKRIKAKKTTTRTHEQAASN